MKKKVTLILFVLVALAQLYIPIHMILGKEKVLDEGTAYRFQIVPIDPNDPFIGMYIVLEFPISHFATSTHNFLAKQEVYVHLYTDTAGYAAISSVDAVEGKMPVIQTNASGDYVKARLRYVSTEYLQIDFPFNRYYMNENIAQQAEDVHRTLPPDISSYALVSVKDGEAVLKGVYFDDMPVEEYLNKLTDSRSH